MPDPKSHLHPGATATDAHPDWADWDEAWTRHIRTLTGRTGLTVTVAPGAGGGAPARFDPDTGRVEVDAVHIGDPKVTDPRKAGHKRLVPTAYGLLVHEAAHAAHSRWRVPDGTSPVVADVAMLLEESRVEYRQRGRRRGDRRWLRHAATTILITGDEAPVDDPWHAGRLAGLLLARVDARILTGKDVRAVRAAVTGVLGRKRLLRLRDVWREAHQVQDTDDRSMIELAWRWCRILGIDPAASPWPPTPDGGVFAGRLAAALADYLAAVLGISTAEYLARRSAERHGAPAAWGRRDPTGDERDAARRLAARLRRARTDQPEPARQPTVLPPGRLRTRAAITADAQRAAGAVPTAAPWQRTTQTPPDKPTLHLAVLVDVSGSMYSFAAPMSSAGWILAHAAHRNQAVTTTVAFGDTVTLLVPPRQQSAQVLEMNAWDGSRGFTTAVKLADRLLDLRHRRTLRMLAVVSDGQYPDTVAAQKLITTLHRSGCAVLWLQPANVRCHTFTDTTTITVTDPVNAVTAIADAAVTALTEA